MKKQTFEKGDRVFDYLKGWGEIVHLYSDNWEEVDDNYTVCVVKFDSSKEIIHFTKYLATKTLSFTEYTLQGFTQEKPVNYEEYGRMVFGPYITNMYYDNFKPLTEEQIKILEL